MTTDVLKRLARLEERVSHLEQGHENTQLPRIGITVEKFRAKMNEPVERGPEQYERLQRIFGSFSGPEDLSANMREYFNGERK